MTHTPGLTSIVVEVGNHGRYLEACLNSIDTHTVTPFELIVVGAPEDDGTLQDLRDRGIARLEPAGGGPSGERNRGISAARGEYICVLDAGHGVTAGWLDSLHAALALPGTAISAPRVDAGGGLQSLRQSAVTDESRSEIAATWAADHAGRTWRSGRLAPFCILTKRDLLERIGGFDERFDNAVLATEELCRRAAATGGTVRVADGAIALRNAEIPPAAAGTLGWVTRASARHFADTRAPQRALCAAVVLSDGQMAQARKSVQQALLVTDRAVVVERGDMEATELAVRGISPDAVAVHALDWQLDDGMAELLETIDADRVLVLGAGELIESNSYEANRAELEALPAGPVRVQVGDFTEVRLHPPTPDAVRHIGGQEGPLVHSFRIEPAS